MRGPLQGAVAAALPTASLFLSWLGAAVVALFVLRHGLGRATPVIAGALLPAAFWMQAGDIGPLTTAVCAVGLALVLRHSRSWSVALLMLPVVVGAWCVAIVFALPEYVEFVRVVFEELLLRFQEQMQRSLSAAELEKLPQFTAPDGVQVIGMIAVMQSITVAFSLLVARWWQAMLYNPGGFRDEFHALRLQRFHALALVAGFVAIAAQTAYPAWGWLFIVPMLIAGTALVHAVARQLGLGGGWLLMFYLMVFVLVRPLMALLAAIAVADSALDFRARLARNR
ncbi:MAG: hypothetical protein KJP25_08760 [Gammaproteobacteria bacterium]|nr:hypothetical protein [Gammaproteobacteria bacterium]